MHSVKQFYRKIEQYRYVVYHLRWQISAIVMMPVMYSLNSFQLPLWATLMLSQFFGALIFWYIDLFIFADTGTSKSSLRRSKK